MKLKSLVACIVTGAACIWSLSASAATLSCTQDGVTFTLTSATQVQCFDGNDTGNVYFGDTFTLGDKTDDAVSGDGTVFFVTFDNSTNPGTWEIDFDLALGQTIDDVVITLKQGSGFAAFLIEDGETSGTWSTSGPGGAVMAISHASVWYDDTNGQVSEPSVLALFGLGILLLGFLRRRTIA